MAARTKAEVVAEAKNICKQFGIQVVPGEHAGESGAKDASMTWEQAVLRLLALQVELLSNIRNSETA